MILHYVEALVLQPLHLIQSGVFKIHAVGLHKSKCIKSHISLCCNLVVELTDRTAAQIPGIFILCIGIPDLLVNFLKIFIGNNSFAPQDQFPLIRDSKRNVFKHSCIVRNYFPHFSVAAGHGFLQRTVPVGQNDRKPVQFP